MGSQSQNDLGWQNQGFGQPLFDKDPSLLGIQISVFPNSFPRIPSIPWLKTPSKNSLS